jgi:coproporphyrinogen III oxidase-like Fe-S oxidoreductase
MQEVFLGNSEATKCNLQTKNPPQMLIEKYVFCLPKALELQKKRKLTSRKLSQYELFVLYCCKKIPKSTVGSIFRYAKKYSAITYKLAIHRAIDFLLSERLIIKEGTNYTISPEGRELLSGIRRFLLNTRIN